MEKQKDLISVIIPCYNASNYIDRCINSVRSQSYVNIEIICVNNNSTDDTYEKLLEHSKVDNRIKLYNSTIQGASAARNEGLSHISGEYVVFVDSDDYVGCDYILNLYNAIVTHNVHMACSIIMRVKKNKKIELDSWYLYEYTSLKFNVVYGFVDVLENISHIPKESVSRIYKVSVLRNNNIYFDENLTLGEDFDFVLRYMNACDNFKCIIINNPDYLYFMNTSSISHNKNKYMDIFDYIDKLTLIFQGNKLYESYLNILFVDTIMYQSNPRGNDIAYFSYFKKVAKQPKISIGAYAYNIKSYNKIIKSPLIYYFKKCMGRYNIKEKFQDIRYAPKALWNIFFKIIANVYSLLMGV